MVTKKFIKKMNKLILNLMTIEMIPKLTSTAQTTMFRLNQLIKTMFQNPPTVNRLLSGVSLPQIHPPTTNLSSKSDKLSLKGDAYDLHKIEQGPSNTSEMTKEMALNCYRQMQQIRRLEKQSASLYLERKIRGFCHLYIGQEACAVGIKTIMGPKDTVITSYRCHAWAMLMGESMEAVLAELLGKTTGSARGKGGSMHIYGDNFFGGNGIVGGHVPLGTGVALAHSYRKNGAISWTIFGDGASDQGQVFESYNIAKLWNLPAVYIIENNMYSMGTAVTRHSANPNYYTRGDLIPGIKVNGMDLLAVREAGKFAADYVRAGNGPIVLQFDTYRYQGHSMSDPGTSYRPKTEVDKVKEHKDCLKLFVDKLIATQMVTNEELKAIEREVKKELTEVTAKCLKANEPPITEVPYDVYLEYKFKLKMPAMSNYIEHKNVSHLVKKDIGKVGGTKTPAKAEGKKGSGKPEAKKEVAKTPIKKDPKKVKK